MLGCAALFVLWLVDREKRFEFSISYLILYNTVCIRVPDVLGHALISSVGDARHYSSPALTATAISCAYMTSMQAYLGTMRWVCQNMSSQHLFPRFYFVAQMYYYLFWYMMMMVVSPGGVEDVSFWLMVAMLNGSALLSNIGFIQHVCTSVRLKSREPDRPLKIVFDSKLAVQDQLADVVSLLIVPAIATTFHVCAFLNTTSAGMVTTMVTGKPSASSAHMGVLFSIWQRFGALLLARLVSGLLTDEFFRRRVGLLYKAEAMELDLLSLGEAHNRERYLNDICVGPKLAHESLRNIERCEFYFAAVAVICTFAVFQRGDVPARYAFISFGA